MTEIKKKNDGAYDVRSDMTSYLDALLKNVMNGINAVNEVVRKGQEQLKLLHKEFSMLKKVRKAARREF